MTYHPRRPRGRWGWSLAHPRNRRVHPRREAFAAAAATLVTFAAAFAAAWILLVLAAAFGR